VRWIGGMGWTRTVEVRWSHDVWGAATDARCPSLDALLTVRGRWKFEDFVASSHLVRFHRQLEKLRLRCKQLGLREPTAAIDRRIGELE
jgi:hypothetical protein